MKTIEEKAIEYSKKVNGEYYNEPHPNCEYTLGEISENDYKSGYLEAQRWIPINKYVPNNYIGYINFKKNDYISCKKIDSLLEFGNIVEAFGYTHWRPVEKIGRAHV